SRPPTATTVPSRPVRHRSVPALTSSATSSPVPGSSCGQNATATVSPSVTARKGDRCCGSSSRQVHSSAPEAGSRPTISGPRSTTTASRVVSSTRVPYRSDHTTVPSARTASNPFPAGSSTNHSTPGASGEAGAGFTEPSSSVTTSPSSSTTAPRPEADPTANRPGPSSCTQDHTSPSASTWSIRAPSRAKVAYTPQPSSTTLRALVVTDTRSASTVASGPSPCSAQAIASTGVNATSARQRSVPVVASSRTTRTSRP